MEYPSVLKAVGPTGVPFEFRKRERLHYGRPAYDMKNELHRTLCWTPYAVNPVYGFWSISSVWGFEENGTVSGTRYETPEHPSLDGPDDMPITATMSVLPPYGWWTRGHPWRGDTIEGGRTFKLLAP